MSQDQHWLGPSATSSGLTRAGWVAWRRLSPVSPRWRSSRYIVEVEHRESPSSSRVAHTLAGAWSQNRSSWRVSSTAWRSTLDSARGCGRGDGRGGRGGGGDWRCARYQLARGWPVARAWPAGPGAGGGGGG